LSELEREKLEGQRLANEISQTKLRRLREEVKETREVKFVYDHTLTVLRQKMLRWPGLAVREPELLRLMDHVQLHAVRMAFDKFIRARLDEVADAFTKGLWSPGAVIREITGEVEPSQKDLDAAARKKSRANAKRRERRKVKP
jgi:hypothetical protein